MNTLLTILLLGNLSCFIISLFFFLNPLKAKNQENIIDNWKLHLILIIISSILFFTYFTSAIQSTGATTTINDGTTSFIIKDNNYMEAMLFLQLITAMFVIQIAFFIAGIINKFEILGRPRFNG